MSLRALALAAVLLAAPTAAMAGPPAPPAGAWEVKAPAHQRVIDDVDRHGSTLYNFPRMRASLAVLLPLVAATVVTSAQGARRAVSLVVIGGTVLTEN